jgi:hypothetical protein
MRWLLVAPLAALLAVMLVGCVTKLGKDGRSASTVDAKYLLKTEVDRIADISRGEVTDGLLLIADKLYRRNPREWKKAGLASREAALTQLRQLAERPESTIAGWREDKAALLAFSEAYEGDRVAALMFGLLTMADAAFNHQTEYFMLDALDEQQLYACARNLEIAIWKLANDRDAAGQRYLLANELDPANRNLSFEREFGRLIGVLDVLAKVVADRNGRSVSRLSQAVATTIFFPISFIK